MGYILLQIPLKMNKRGFVGPQNLIYVMKKIMIFIGALVFGCTVVGCTGCGSTDTEATDSLVVDSAADTIVLVLDSVPADSFVE